MTDTPPPTSDDSATPSDAPSWLPEGASETPVSEQRKVGKLQSTKAKVVAGVVAVVVIAAIGGGVEAAISGHSNSNTANAQQRNRGNFPGGGGTVGTIKSINGTSLVVTSTNNNADTNVTTSSSTTYTKTATGALASVKVGDHVTVSGSDAGTNAVEALNFTDSGTIDQSSLRGAGGGAPPAGNRPSGNGQRPAGAPNGGAPNGAGGPGPGGAGGGFTSGTVKSITGSTIVVTSTSNTDVTVTTTPATSFSQLSKVDFSALAVGDTVRVVGTTSSGTVAATSIEDGLLGGFGGRRNTTSTTAATS